MIGKEISHYKLLQLLGQGGMGKVFKAQDTRNGEMVALKILTQYSSDDEEMKKRFQREAAAGLKLQHPNIVKIREVGEAGAEMFICMELVQGKTLRQILKDGPLSPARVVEIGIGVCQGLAAAHQLGIIHRDIKSENIMITDGGQVKIMDFGLAKMQNATMLTKEGDLLGTVAYMSPQQAIGEKLDARTDIFSLGVLLYELLTDQMPFTGEYEMAVLYSVLNEEPASFREIKPEIPVALEQVVFNALKKNLEARYQSAEELRKDLEQIQQFLSAESPLGPEKLDLIAKAELGRTEERGFLAKLVGRDSQLEELKKLLKRSSFGEGQSVFLAGEAGIGKSRLVWELEKYARTLKVRTLNGRCLFRENGYPYQPFVEAIREYLDIEGESSAIKLDEFVRNRAPELTRQLPVIRLFLNLKNDDNFVLESKEQLWDTIFKLIVKISQEQPIIIAIDDLHWADTETLSFFYYTARNTVHHKVMMAGTYRPEDVRETEEGKIHPLIEIQREMRREGLLTVMTLERLSLQDIHHMAQSLFENATFEKSFYQVLYKETEGNPFFIMEMLKFFKAEEIIQKTAEGYHLSDKYQHMTIPHKIHDIVMKRIDRLTEEEREILEIGAVEGEAFHSGAIAHCLEMNRIRLLRKLQSLEREHHIIHPQEKMYRFDHGKIQEILYDSLNPELRIEYHLMIGEYLAQNFGEEERLAPNIARHLLEGGKEISAFPFLVTAGERAREIFANDQALNFYRRALEILDNAPEEKIPPSLNQKKEVILSGLADVLALTGEHDAALMHYTQVLSQPDLPPLHRVDLFGKIGLVHISKGEIEEAMEIISRAEEQLKLFETRLKQSEAGDGKETDFAIRWTDFNHALGKIKITRSRIFKSRGEYDLARLDIEEGLRRLRKDAAQIEKGRAYNTLGNIIYDQGNFTEAEKMYRSSLKIRQTIADKKGIAETYNNLANVYYEQGDYQKSAEMLEKSLEIMIEIGFRVGIAGTYNNLGTIYQDQGRFEKAYEVHTKSLNIRQEIGDQPGVAMSYANLGSVCMDLKQWDEARQYLEKSLRLIGKMGLKVYEPQIRIWFSQVLAEFQNWEEARQEAEKALALANELRQRSLEAMARRILGEIAMARLETSAPPAKGNSASLQIETLLSESIQIFEELHMEHEIGRSYLALARFLSLRNETDRAQELFRKAQEIFQKLNAYGDLDKLQEYGTVSN